jgi:hypothetical protein
MEAIPAPFTTIKVDVDSSVIVIVYVSVSPSDEVLRIDEMPTPGSPFAP